MSEEKHHHSLFGWAHKKSEEESGEEKPVSHIDEYPEAEESAIPIEKTPYYHGPPPADADSDEVDDDGKEKAEAEAEAKREKEEEAAKKEEKSSARKEHFGESIGAAAAAFALYERHEAKKDDEHKGRHKLEERFAEAVTVAAGGYALHEHHEKKEAKEEEEKLEEGEHKKKHFFF